MDNNDLAVGVINELEKSKKKQKKVADELKKWAEGNDQIYDENGKRISGEPLVSYENLTDK